MGIVETIEGDNVEVFVEYMDSYRSTSDTHKDLLLSYYKERYENLDLSAIVIADNYAFDFMRDHYNDLFVNVPIVFGGINNFSMSQLFVSQSTGVAQTSNQLETIELIEMLHPDVTHIVAVAGNNKTGLAESQAIVDVGNSFANHIVFERLISDNLEAQLRSLAAYGNKTAVIISGTIRDSSGEFYDHADYSSAIIDEVGLPTYAMASVYIEGDGAVGGYVVDPYVQGTLMGNYVLRILEGEEANTIPVIEKPESYYLFDYNRLRTFRIQLEDLPEGSQVLNKPEHLYEINRIFIVLYLGIAFFLMLIIIIMLVNIRRRQRAEEELNKQNDVLQHMAFHDSTTNLYNRKYIVDYLQDHLLEPDHHFTALYDLDITNLKMINDTYGHEVGNKVLKHVASILKKSFKSARECVGTYHSEFLIIDSQVVSSENALKKAHHLMDVIARSIEVDYMEIDIKVNIGIAIAPYHSMDSKQLLKKKLILL